MASLPVALQSELEAVLGSPLHYRGPIGGGDIHHACRLQKGEQEWFCKYSAGPDAPQMLQTESLGLERLRQTRALAIPRVLKAGRAGDYGYLLLEYLPAGAATDRALQDLGRGLAQLHRHASPTFGLDHDNFIGRLPQSNGRHTSFPDFYTRERLWPQYEMAAKRGLMDKKDGQELETLCDRLPQMIPEEPPALVHGDLWSGNYLIHQNGTPYLIDPAVAFSHREADIGMSRLFGGFGPAFYAAYQEEYPLAPGWEARVPLFQLYYLLVHLNLFGSSYYASVKRAMQV